MGAALGVVCIVGAMLRSDEALDPLYLTAFWYNRVLIGLMLGLAKPERALKNALIKGGILGFVVSFAFYITTGFNDFTGFFAGIVYGLIIATVLYRFDQSQD